MKINFKFIYFIINLINIQIKLELNMNMIIIITTEIDVL
jgi:hypothetical protein